MSKYTPKKENNWGIVISIGIASVLVAAGFVVAYLVSTSHKVELTEEFVQEQINGTLPIEFKGVRIEEGGANVSFVDNALQVEIVANAQKFGQDLILTINATGAPRYDRETGSFYYTPTDISSSVEHSGRSLSERAADVDLQSAADKVEETVSAIADEFLQTDAAKGFLKRLGTKAEEIAVEKAPDAETSLQAGAALTEEWIEATARTAATRVLTETPVYTITASDMKTRAARLALESVEVVGSTLVITFTFLQVMKYLLYMAIVLVIALAAVVALAQTNGWGFLFFLGF